MKVTDEEKVNLEGKGKELVIAELPEGNELVVAEFPTTYVRIKPRTALSTVVDIMKNMKTNQKKAVDEIGFVEFRKHFKVTAVPTILGQWVVENYNPETNKFMMQNGKEITVTPEYIHEVLGVPMGKTEIKYVERARETNSTTSKWRKQFNIEGNRFYVTILTKKLMEQKKGDFDFKLNFLVLFATYMGECISNGTVFQLFLPFIDNEEDLKDLNWCTFLLKCMNRTRRKWNLKANFNGPLALMVVSTCIEYCFL